MRRFDQVVDIGLREASRETPSADWRVVVAFAGISFAVCLVTFIAGLMICKAFHWPTDVAWGLSGLLTLGAEFWLFKLLPHWTMTRETVTAAGPGVPELPKPEIRVEVETADDRTLRYLDLPIRDQAQLGQFASRLLDGYPLSEGEWSGGGKMFSKRQFHDLRDQMIARGMAQWRDKENPSQGVQLTRLGLHALRAIKEQAERPMLEGE